MLAYDSSRFHPPAPLALVSLQNINSGQVVSDVPMLIDSGADATLIPLSVCKQLDLPCGSQAFELEGFDGTRSAAETVQGKLLFLKRSFMGEYLTIDQEYGYLGRDILNHISLMLDGPRLIWDEQK